MIESPSEYTLCLPALSSRGGVGDSNHPSQSVGCRDGHDGHYDAHGITGVEGLQVQPLDFARDPRVGAAQV